MKFNINTLTDAILEYMNKHDVQNPVEFPTLAFYKCVTESGLQDTLALNITAENNGKLKLVQKGLTYNVIDLKIKDPSVPDPADDPKNKPIYMSGVTPKFVHIELDADQDTSVKKRFFIQGEQMNQMPLDKVLTNEMKEQKLSVYRALSTYDKFSDLCNNIGDYQPMIKFGDRKLYELSQAIFSYQEYQKSLKETQTSDEIVIPSVLNRHLENTLKSLIALSEKSAQTSHKKYNNLDKLADVIRGDVQYSDSLLLVGDNTFKVFGMNDHVVPNDTNMQNVNFDGFLLKTIKENVEKGTPQNIIDDIYQYHINPEFKEEYGLRLKMTERQKTIENRLDHPDLNNFIETLKVKHPYIFKDNELFSYRSGVLENTEKYTNMLDIFNTFKMNNKETKRDILDQFTDTFMMEKLPIYNINNDDLYVRLIGETDASVKSLITGEIVTVSDQNPAMKMFKVSSLILLDEKDNQFNKMACEELFSYCAKNKLALYIKHEEPADVLDLAHKTLIKVAKAYKDKVYFIENSNRFDKIHLLSTCTTDMDTLLKGINDGSIKKPNYRGMKPKGY